MACEQCTVHQQEDFCVRNFLAVFPSEMLKHVYIRQLQEIWPAMLVGFCKTKLSSYLPFSMHCAAEVGELQENYSGEKLIALPKKLSTALRTLFSLMFTHQSADGYGKLAERMMIYSWNQEDICFIGPPPTSYLWDKKNTFVEYWSTRPTHNHGR